ncbi:DNA (cytosine-5-)-methyltransferase [Kaistia algarum]|uniref:DNA cytosine methyltransferase n=1 Tax=Kaistia algarum TaxID=2083279 RepID=UPI000CE81989|nr:DNA cytosine methyltransferase [Kaistia algarum]MCX5511914.1 DNA cytosine methyltransferase [Kaistia algarum]PPE80047.1 DNA (cytosine-5-)-methyltransferase [Kaistia algarum]
MVDLFCGCGGLALGARASGFGAELAFDIDAILSSSFKHNFPDSRLQLGNLAEAHGRDIKAMAGGEIIGVFGGPPCQAFSDIGHRKLDDPRRDLLDVFFRLVAEIEPAFFVMENVRGLGYSDSKPVLDKALDRVAERYELVGPLLLDAANYGAATRRRRLFVIGYDPTRCDPLMAEDLARAELPAVTVKDAIWDLHDATEVGIVDGFDTWRLESSEANGYRSALISKDRLFTGHRPTIHTSAVVERFLKVEQGEVDIVGRHPRLHWDRQCPTLRAGTGSDRGSFQSVRPIHPDEPRVISVREAARLQGFPDHFRFHPTIWHSFRMIGNSVSPPMSRAIFSLLASRTEMPQAAIAAE